MSTIEGSPYTILEILSVDERFTTGTHSCTTPCFFFFVQFGIKTNNTLIPNNKYKDEDGIHGMVAHCNWPACRMIILIIYYFIMQHVQYKELYNIYSGVHIRCILSTLYCTGILRILSLSIRSLYFYKVIYHSTF